MIAVRVTPRAGRHAITGLRNDTLIIRLAAAPVEGAANEALTDLLASVLDVPRREVSLISGARSRHKRVAVRGWRADVLNQRLARVLNSPGGAGTL